jgi:hypothetical protein
MTGIKQWQIKPGSTTIRGRAAPQFSGGEEKILSCSLGNMELYYDFFF